MIGVMKKAALVLCVVGLGAGVFGQGTITMVNGSANLISTNAIGVGGTAGPTSPHTVQAFYYGLFTASPTVTSLSPLDLLTPAWTFTGLYATNTANTNGGRLNGGINVVVPTGWPANVTNSFAVAGWS